MTPAAGDLAPTPADEKPIIDASHLAETENSSYGNSVLHVGAQRHVDAMLLNSRLVYTNVHMMQRVTVVNVMKANKGNRKELQSHIAGPYVVHAPTIPHLLLAHVRHSSEQRLLPTQHLQITAKAQAEDGTGFPHAADLRTCTWSCDVQARCRLYVHGELRADAYLHSQYAGILPLPRASRAHR